MKKKTIIFCVLFALFTFLNYRFALFRRVFYTHIDVGVEGIWALLITLFLFILIQIPFVIAALKLTKRYFKSSDEIKRFLSIALFCICISATLFNVYEANFRRMYCVITPTVRVYTSSDLDEYIKVDRELLPKHIEVDRLKKDFLGIEKDNPMWDEYTKELQLPKEVSEIFIEKIFIQSYSYLIG